MTALINQLGLPAFERLPELSATEVQAIASETAQVLQDLLAKDSLAPATVRSYSSALRYWDAWHRAATGSPLPLLRTPRAPVPAETVCAFIAHHAPVHEGGEVRMGMPPFVLARMQNLGAIGNRLVSRRSAGRARAEVPSAATIRHRVAALTASHRLAGIVPNYVDAPEVRQAIKAFGNRVSREAPAMLRQPKAPVLRDMLQAMLANCLNDGLRGIRDAAVLHIAFHGGGRRRSEVVAMRWGDLEPMERRGHEGAALSGYQWTIHAAKGRRRDRADRGVLHVPLVGPAADALDRWRDALIAHGIPAEGAVWYRVIRSRDHPGGWTPSTLMIENDIREIVRSRAEEAGFNADDFAAHSLRSGAATTFLQEGGQLADASALLDHASLDTTRDHYDHRGMPIAAIERLASRHKEA